MILNFTFMAFLRYRIIQQFTGRLFGYKLVFQQGLNSIHAMINQLPEQIYTRISTRAMAEFPFLRRTVNTPANRKTTVRAFVNLRESGRVAGNKNAPLAGAFRICFFNIRMEDHPLHQNRFRPEQSVKLPAGAVLRFHPNLYFHHGGLTAGFPVHAAKARHRPCRHYG